MYTLNYIVYSIYYIIYSIHCTRCYCSHGTYYIPYVCKKGELKPGIEPATLYSVAGKCDYTRAGNFSKP